MLDQYIFIFIFIFIFLFLFCDLRLYLSNHGEFDVDVGRRLNRRDHLGIMILNGLTENIA